MMLSRISLLPLAVLSLLAISAKSTPDPPVAPTDKPASPPKKLPLSIRYKNQNRSVELDFEATETEAYYLIEGRTQLDEGDWSLGYGIKGDGQAQSTEMPAQSRTGFYRMQLVQEDSPLMKKDYDGDKVVALDELKRGLNAFEKIPDDSDSDGIPSDVEVRQGLDKSDASDDTDTPLSTWWLWLIAVGCVVGICGWAIRRK